MADVEFQVVRHCLDWELGAADVLRLVRADTYPVALLGAWAGGSDIITSEPVRVCSAPAPVSAVLDPPLSGSGLDGRTARGARFCGVWIGYLGFGAAGG
jgi:hypothetical protein